jgi:hypothetical protein
MRHLAALAFVLVAAAGGHAAVPPVSDGTFDAADWEIGFVTFGSGGGALGGGGAQGSQAAEGHPAPARRIDLTLPPAPAPTEYSSTFAFNIRKGFVYDPMTQGPIATIDYEEDARVLSAPQLTGLVVRQGTEVYFVQVEVFISTAWSHVVRKAIVRTNFEHLVAGGAVQGEYPDLSENGAPIEVGFLRANSTGEGRPTGFTNGALIDNWKVKLNPPCTLDSECDDGDACATEACVGGACQSTPLPCDDGDACTLDGCAAGACIHPPLDCDDGDSCTSDTCGAGACQHAAVSCDDAEACTADQCVDGSCVHTLVSTEALVEGKIDELLGIARGSCAGEPLAGKFGKRLVKKLKKARAKVAAADAATRAALIAKLVAKAGTLLAAADTLLGSAIANGLVGPVCGAELTALLDSIRGCAEGL